MATILPDIVKLAQSYDLRLNQGTLQKHEVLSKCPFCRNDEKPGKERRFYLWLNQEKQTFKCWSCGESGGVIRFESLLSGIPEEQVLSQYRKRKLLHPTEGLSHRQLVLLGKAFGYASEPDWQRMKQRDQAYYLRTLDRIWSDWQRFVEEQKHEAFKEIHLGICCGKYPDSIARIQKQEQLIGVPLLEEALMIYSCAERPAWTQEIVQCVQSLLHFIKHPINPESHGK